MKKLVLLAVLSGLAGAAPLAVQPAGAQTAPAAKPEPSLKPGMAAPPFAAQKWWGSEPETALQKGKVYVVDFWATWCGPCRMAMPHLSEMSEKYAAKGVRTVAVNVWDTGKVETVENFINKGAAKNYKFIWALDEGDRNGKMSQAWMRAAGRNGIPSTFVIDRDGKIAWIGHPFSAERVVEAVANGTFDAAKEEALAAQLQKIDVEQDAAAKANDWAKVQELNGQKNQLDPHGKFMNDIDWFFTLVTKKKDYPAANALGRTLVEKTFKDNAAFLNMIGNQLAVIPNEKERDAALIEQVITRVKELNGNEDERWFKTAAVAIAATKGDYAKAVQLQEAIVNTAVGPMKAMEQKKLDELKAKLAP